MAERGVSLVVTGLCSGYSDVQVLRDVSFTLEPGTVTTVIGPNGAGKSTLLKSIFGMTRVTAGQVELDGRSLLNMSSRALLAAGVAIVPQGRCNFPRMTVQENLEMGAFTLDRAQGRRAVEAAYQRFPLLAQKRAQEAAMLSGGQQQILEMAMAMLVEPSLLLIDEPSLGLAPLTLAEVLDEVAGISRNGVTVLMVEQNARQALLRSDRGIVLELGRKALEGTGQELLDDPRLAELYLGGTRAR